MNCKWFRGVETAVAVLNGGRIGLPSIDQRVGHFIEELPWWWSSLKCWRSYWLYPGGHDFTVPPGVITNDPDHGGHATKSTQNAF
jgi:hypothetical protein